ncbi:DEAD/DEAH box helicase [Metabacillus sp. RGM 3146]|uniref:DEAD/DEAH box helicase n=1 Tax=Metabacillus sp. RGM 3146 TaxID=3401092 RepID=UPI003B99A544
MMGRLSECTSLIRWTGPLAERKEETHLLHWDGSLSPMQTAASQKMAEAVHNPKELLIWAVCGAGKTEILFEGIQAALQAGKNVCLATPRTDVVLELEPRFRKVFPSVTISALYGGSEDRYKPAMLTLATTHQLLRYYHAFDVMIIDEVDAFPYSMDATLQNAVNMAIKPLSTLIYLTATPSYKMQQKVARKKMEAIKIPGRYHGQPLPEPRFDWAWNWKKKLEKGMLPASVDKWISSHLAEKKQAFLFVSNINVLKEITTLLKKRNQAIEGIYAEDPERKEKVRKFRTGETPLIVTTTILERGVTIKNSDAAVLGAEDSVFTESALVQISGRVGRHADFPSGDVVFFHHGKTEAMLKAKEHIQIMNRLAGKR